MKSFAWSRTHAGPKARVLAMSEWPQAIEIARRDPVASVLALVHMEVGLQNKRSLGEIWGYPESGPLAAVCWAGGNLIPIVPPQSLSEDERLEALGAFAQLAAKFGRRCSSIVGPRRDVLMLWSQLEDKWRAPREIRASQPSMVMTEPSRVDPDPLAIYATPEDFDAVFPASVHMFIEEVGVSPLSFGSSQYAARVQELIALRRTIIRSAPESAADSALDSVAGPLERRRDQVVFKADFGAIAGGVAQVQGVWVAPEHRGKGISVPGMASVVALGLRDKADIVSLYVNDYNTRALAAYRHVGFEQVGEYATILF